MVKGAFLVSSLLDKSEALRSVILFGTAYCRDSSLIFNLPIQNVYMNHSIEWGTSEFFLYMNFAP